MPLKLVPPTPGRNKVYRVRGTYLGRYVDRSTETGEPAVARRFLKACQRKIERGEFSDKPELSFAAAAAGYMKAGGDARFLTPILKHVGGKAAKSIDQTAIDEAAAKLYPDASPATRNRQVYTPISAVLRHVGITLTIRRPRGAQGTSRSVWLRLAQFEALATAATALDEEFGILVTVLCYTGLRLSEGLRLDCAGVDLSAGEALCGRTKNGHPRVVYLPYRAVAAMANHPRGLDRKDRVFRWTKGSEIYLLAERAYAEAGVDHGGAPFHILRHTYGAWMTRAGADLVETGAWRSPTAARVYNHFDLTEEARKADKLPGASRALSVRKENS